MDFWSEKTKKKGSEQIHTSPCGRYKLTIWNHTTGRNTWDYTSGLVEEVSEKRDDETDQLYKGRIWVARINRNYSAFPFCWLVRGEETFLFYGEDYQGYGCLKCSTGERADFLPFGYRRGVAFCWAKIEVDPESENHLIVEGCYWACPYERRRYDVTNPFAFPYPEEDLGYVDEGEEGDEDDENS